MATLADVLGAKGSDVITVQSDRTVLEAIEVLVQNGIGALLVVDPGDEIAGILSERDILREVRVRSGEVGERKVGDIMTRDLIIGLPGDDLDYVRGVMTEKRIRHLPVMKDGRLCGLVSQGDLVKADRTQKAYEVRLLRDYITDRYPG